MPHVTECMDEWDGCTREFVFVDRVACRVWDLWLARFATSGEQMGNNRIEVVGCDTPLKQPIVKPSKKPPVGVSSRTHEASPSCVYVTV